MTGGGNLGLGSRDENIRYIRRYISDISVDISLIYPISVMFDTILAMIDISPNISWKYRFWTNISCKYQVCGTRAR